MCGRLAASPRCGWRRGLSGGARGLSSVHRGRGARAVRWSGTRTGVSSVYEDIVGEIVLLLGTRLPTGGPLADEPPSGASHTRATGHLSPLLWNSLTVTRHKHADAGPRWQRNFRTRRRQSCTCSDYAATSVRS